jgi:hypothetical protein
MGTFYGNRTTRKGRRSPGADRALARRSIIARAPNPRACRWKVIRSFIMKSGSRSCALAAASSSALGISRRKITHTSTSIWAMPVRSAAPIALRYSVSIRAWAHTKLIRQIVLTVTWTKLKSSNAASLVMLPAGAFGPEITKIPPMDEVLRRYRRPLTEHRPEHKLNRDSAVPRLIHCRGSF